MGMTPPAAQQARHQWVSTVRARSVSLQFMTLPLCPDEVATCLLLALCLGFSGKMGKPVPLLGVLIPWPLFP